MINNDRIIPIQKIDFLSLIGIILKIAGVSYDVLASKDVKGTFFVEATGDAGNLLADQPVCTLDFADGATAGVVYFVPAYDFGGFKIAGADVEATGDVDADGITLYTATLADGAITVAKV